MIPSHYPEPLDAPPCLIPECFVTFYDYCDNQNEWRDQTFMCVQSFWFDFSYCENSSFGVN